MVELALDTGATVGWYCEPHRAAMAYWLDHPPTPADFETPEGAWARSSASGRDGRILPPTTPVAPATETEGRSASAGTARTPSVPDAGMEYEGLACLISTTSAGATPAPATTPPPALSFEEAQRAALAERLLRFSETATTPRLVYSQSALTREDLVTLRSMLDEREKLREVVRLFLASEKAIRYEGWRDHRHEAARLLAPYVGTDPELRAFCDEWFPEAAR